MHTKLKEKRAVGRVESNAQKLLGPVLPRFHPIEFATFTLAFELFKKNSNSVIRKGLCSRRHLCIHTKDHTISICLSIFDPPSRSFRSTPFLVPSAELFVMPHLAMANQSSIIHTSLCPNNENNANESVFVAEKKPLFVSWPEIDPSNILQCFPLFFCSLCSCSLMGLLHNGYPKGGSNSKFEIFFPEERSRRGTSPSSTECLIETAT